jgi:hypothetical protein
MTKDERTPWWASHLLWILIAITSTIPFWVTTVPPLTDLPNHIARFYLLLNLDRSPFLAKYYAVHWHLIGNLGVDIPVRLLGPMLGAELAARMVVAMIPPLTVAGIYAVSRALNGQVAPSALVAVALVYNWPFNSGFVNFSLSSAMALLILAAWIRLRDLSFLTRLLVFVPLSFATWVAHIAGWGLLGLAVLGFELTRAYQSRGFKLRSFFVAAFETFPFALMIIFTALWRSETSSPVGFYYNSAVFLNKLLSLVTIFREEYVLWDVLCSAVFLLLTVVMFISGGRRIVVAAAVITALYLLAFAVCPEGLFAGAFLDRRLLPFAAMFFAMSLGVTERVLQDKHGRRFLSFIAFGAIGLFAARIVVTTIVWERINLSMVQHLALLDQLPPQSRVFGLMIEPCEKSWPRGRLDHLQQFAVTRRESVINGLFQESGLNEVEASYRRLDGFDPNMLNTVHSAACPVPYIRETFQSAIERFPRSQFDYVWLVSPDPLPAFDDTGLELVSSVRNDRLFKIIAP